MNSIGEWRQCPIDGVGVLVPGEIRDRRGSFVKTFRRDAFLSFGADFEIREAFFTVSDAGVLRGMHFQTPPRAHAKVVTCLAGRVLDVLLDIRAASTSFGKTYSVELSAANRIVLFIPAGIAHGFLALEDRSLVHYMTDCEHSPEHDSGIRWDSFGFPWPAPNPTLSDRDLRHPPLAEFRTPFP